MTRWPQGIAGMLLGAVVALAGADAALAQGAACADMQSQYLAALRTTGTNGNAGQRMVQMERLSKQLADAQMAARRNNCNTFLFFGPPPTNQCPAIRATINQLRQQIAQARQGRDLTSFSPEQERERLRNWLTRSGCDIPSGSGGSSNRTLCVRACDGYYFPITFSGNRSVLEKDAATCQSMYSTEGEAQLFYQPAGRDVAEARSLSNQRYGDQPYAFLFREGFYQVCQNQLKQGIAALAERYLTTMPMQKIELPNALSSVAKPAAMAMPMPTMRPVDRQEDPETVANRAGKLPIEPYLPHQSGDAVASIDGIRLVGAAYYAELFDPTKAPVEPPLHRPPLGFDLIGSAMAAETGSIAPANEPATTIP